MAHLSGVVNQEMTPLLCRSGVVVPPTGNRWHLMVFQGLLIQCLQQIELALAYNCEEAVGTERLGQYIHQNRNHNALRINTLGKTCTNQMNHFCDAHFAISALSQS